MSYKYNCNEKCDNIRKGSKKEEQLIEENIDQITLVKATKTLSLMDLES